MTTHYEEIVVQIATPQSVGTGFYLADFRLIATNYHVVEGSKYAVITDQKAAKYLTKVVFTDPKHDLALLEMPENISLINVGIDTAPLQSGDEIVAIGHPFGLKYSTTQGIVSNPNRLQPNGLQYIQIDAAINPGNSGGPLLNKNGEIVGINTFIIKASNNLGFALPSRYLAQALEEYAPHKPDIGTRCAACSNIVTETNIDGRYCPYCGNDITLVSSLRDYTPTGIAATIETIIDALGYPVPLVRNGANHWLVERGSARILVYYDEKTGFITGDAVLCSLPKTGIKPLYAFLLEENYRLNGASLSIMGQDIVLSATIFDHNLNMEHTKNLLQYLFETADAIDDVLIHTYGALPRVEEV